MDGAVSGTAVLGIDEVPGGGPVPASVPGEFTARLSEGWVESLHDLAGGLREWELGAEVAVELLLTWLEWVEVEIQGFEDPMERLYRLRGAVMVAALAAG